ncbi:MAG: DUF480 domain-containing protein [Planctomycetales bacterium]|nr:DUF480 domain-containing protein [Planctomycetales bacterium]
MSDQQATEQKPGPRWRPLEKNQRRVAGVLVEKAKTTPENYPLSLNSLINGCNQKSNRFPQTQLDESHVEDALEQLRALGAVAQIEGDGRVVKYRHLLYEWLGVDKTELAVMAELLLRGAQTLGELRGRAARMEAIKDIGQLQPIVDSLRQKGLIVLLTPPGRGCVVTHALYQAPELAKLRAEFGNAPTDVSRPAPAPAPTQHQAQPRQNQEATQLREEVDILRNQLAELREQFETETSKLRSELQELNRQLGI